MLPLQQAYEVKESILEYIRTTFSIKDRDVNDAFFNFISDPKNGIFKGPYISVRAPYKSEPNADIPLDIKPNFPPFYHQTEAFKKLTTQNGHKPENTILTTGTGSGKTECFMWPILAKLGDEAKNNPDSWNMRGMRVIIMYPMEAQSSKKVEIIINILAILLLRKKI